MASSLASKLKSLPSIRVKGEFFRMVREEDADGLLSAGPSFAFGGRYSKPGEFGALYLSDDPKTCEAEKLKQVAGRRDLLPPQALGRFGADVSGVVDLTDDDNLKKLGVSIGQLTDPLDVTLPREIGAAARSLGIRALLVRSAAALGKNLAVFEEGLTSPDCTVKVINTQRWTV
ncbi:MAG: RES family NAD+ phosphorylase [Elusimicrobiota bacterium]